MLAQFITQHIEFEINQLIIGDSLVLLLLINTCQALGSGGTWWSPNNACTLHQYSQYSP